MRLVIIFLLLLTDVTAQVDSIYNSAYKELNEMLNGKKPINFKKAVFTVENAYLDTTLSYNSYEKYIQSLTKVSLAFRKANRLTGYKYADSTQVAISGSLFRILTDTIYAIGNKPVSFPFKYDFDDIFGEKDWTKMFVTKLIATQTGNCHSLPFLYKILCEEQGIKAYLAFAPNHIYIKQRNKKDGWYNTELTSGVFPLDAWVMASGYVSTETIRNGLYMDTLSPKQSIAVCLIDLARGYERKGQNYYDFILNCCNTALKYYPNFAEGLLYKAEILKKQGLKEKHKEMSQTYVALAKMGYREIPHKMYLEWINSLEKDREKYQNSKINDTFNSSKQPK